MRSHSAVIALCLACSTGPALAQTPQATSEERIAEVARAAGPIDIDGRLDEPAWQEAPVTQGFVQNEPREGEPATFDTEVRVLYDDDAIYFGIVAADPELGIFRVWSQGRNTRWLFPEGFVAGFDYRTYPLTPAALAAVERFDYLEQDPTIACKPKGIPVIMEQPYPIEFVDAAERVLLRIEEYDLVRTIHVGNAPDEADQPYSPLGFSVGRMEGRDLVVETTKINSGTFDSIGIPLSVEARLEERFAPSEDGSTMEYTLIVNDPVNFTAPVRTGKTFIHVPGIEVRKFDCRA